MKKRIIIIAIIILTPILIFILGDFHFSKIDLLERDISVNKINNIDCGFWKNKSGGIGPIHTEVLEFN